MLVVSKLGKTWQAKIGELDDKVVVEAVVEAPVPELVPEPVVAVVVVPVEVELAATTGTGVVGIAVPFCAAL